MLKSKPGWMGPAFVLLAFAAIVGSCAVLGIAPSEVAGPRLFGFPGNWSQVPAKTITLFYPGQASWEFLTSNAHQVLRP
jgi:hypothetical protein